MAGKTMYSCTLTVNSSNVANLKEVTYEATMDTHESSDLGSDWATTERGVKKWTATARTEFNGTNFPLLSQLAAHDSQVNVIFKDKSGTTILAGACWITRGAGGGGESIGTGDIAFTGTGAPSTIR